MSHPLQPRFEGFAAERRPQLLVDGDPVAGRVQGLLGQVDRARADVFMRVKSDLLEHARERGDLHLAVTSSDCLAVGAREGVQHLHSH